MKVLITGTSSGIGLETAKLFCKLGHDVVGIDKTAAKPFCDKFTPITLDINDYHSYPDIPDVNILVNNAGTDDEKMCMRTNMEALYHITEQYGMQPHIKAIINIASVSAHNGAEWAMYAASKGAVLAYTKNVAHRVAEYGATCNSISPGGVITPMNQHILDNKELTEEVLGETTLGKWATAREIAEWIVFLGLCNKSMTGQDIIIDNGETTKFNFVW